jgi:hypothetical protein
MGPSKMLWCSPCEVDANAPAEDTIAQFPYFGARMVHLLEQMEYWKPRTPNELLIPGYPDRMGYYVASFGFFIGIVAVATLGLSGYQTSLAYRSLEAALHPPA